MRLKTIQTKSSYITVDTNPRWVSIPCTAWVIPLMISGCIAEIFRRWQKRSSRLKYAVDALGARFWMLWILEWHPSMLLSAVLTLDNLHVSPGLTTHKGPLTFQFQFQIYFGFDKLLVDPFHLSRCQNEEMLWPWSSHKSRNRQWYSSNGCLKLVKLWYLARHMFESCNPLQDAANSRARVGNLKHFSYSKLPSCKLFSELSQCGIRMSISQTGEVRIQKPLWLGMSRTMEARVQIM